MIIKTFYRIVNQVHVTKISITQKVLKYSTKKLISQAKPTTAKLPEVPIYIKKDEHYRITKKDAVKKLQELFSYRAIEASEIISKYTKFSTIPTYAIGENYYSCINQAISKETLKKHPGILAESDIPLKIKSLKTLPLDINITAPLLLLRYTLLAKFVVKEVIEGRIEIFSRLFETEKSEVCEWMAKKPFLLTLDINNLNTNLRLLSEFGITNKDIIRDFWVLKYSPTVIKERLKLAKSHKIDTIKSWMVRAQADIFNNYVKRKSDNKSILGDNSLVEHLSERLECTEEIAKYIISKQPALQNKSLKKMNEIIDFLLVYGFKPIHICRTPKILLHSVETIKKRLKEMETLGMQLDTLYILTKSQKQYNQVLESLKTNKSKLKN